MRKLIEKEIKESLIVKQKLLVLIPKIEQAVEMIVNSYKSGGKLILFGNGGSAADAQHIAAELVGRFQIERKALNAVALSTNTSILTAIGNDYGFDRVFERQLEGLAGLNDTVIGITTSGNSKNVLLAVNRAKKLKFKTIGLTGGDGGKLKKISDLCIVVPSSSTARIQEAHITIGHIICKLVEMQMSVCC